MHGKGIIAYKNGDTYSGYFKQDRRNGIGHLTTGSYEYFGPFVEDYKCGKGTLFLGNGDKFEGWFEKDRVHGYGELHKKNGQTWKKMY